MPSLAQIRALLSLNIGWDVGKVANVLSNAEIEAAIRARFPGAKITAHDVIPAQPETKFGPFESTSRVTLQGAPGSLNDSLFGLSQDLKQQAIPGINHSTNEAVLAGPQAADWGGEFSKSHFVHPGDQTAFGNRQEDFKKQFTGGFYHGSPANNIEAFDPTKSVKDPMYITPKATFVTRDPEFAESFLSMNNSGKVKSGSTMYPVSVNLGQHWHPNTQEGQQVISDFIEKYPKRVNLEKGLKRGDWTAIENSDFLTHLKDTGHDTFHVVEGGIPNVGVLKPENIRGKFAEYNPDEAMNPDFMKAAGGLIHMAGGGVNLPEGGDLMHHQIRSSLPDVSVDVRTMPSMNGMPGVGYMQMPQSAMARMQMEKELDDHSRLHAGVSGIGMAIPGQSGVKLMPGQMDVGYNTQVGPGNLDLSAMRSINPIPGKGHMQGVRANYSIPFSDGGNVENYQVGGAIKKALKFAEDVPFLHYSNHPSLNRLEPSMYGQGIKGQEAARLSAAPDIKDRSYFYVNKGEQTMRPEQGLGSQKYQGTASGVYNAAEDPEGFHAIAKSRALDPYMLSFGREMVDPAVKATELERLIKGAGYNGYHTGDVGLMFHPTPVTKIEGHAAGGEIVKKALSFLESQANKAKFLEGSKVVDHNGKPITMYHHTTDFQGDAFNPALSQGHDRGFHGEGMYFGADDYLKRSAYGKHSSGNVAGQEGFTEGSQVMPVNLAIKNPKYIDVRDQSLYGVPSEELKKQGYDGVIVTRDDSFQNVMGRTIPRQKVYNAVAFEPTQVKSAIGNTGTYDPLDPSLTKKRGGLV